jgi:hypothetical protein
MTASTDTSNLPFSPLSVWMDWAAKSLRWPPLPAGAAAFAPSSLTQPILPDWTFGNSIVINEKNSSSPEAEREIVASDSYGRQLGTIIDALVVLIQQRPKDAPQDQALTALVKLRGRVETIKTQVAAARLHRIESDLANLKKNDYPEYRRILAAVEADAGPASS